MPDVAAVGGLSIGVRHALRLVHCFYDCGEFAFDLAGNVRITITRRAPAVDVPDELGTEAAPSSECC